MSPWPVCSSGSFESSGELVQKECEHVVTALLPSTVVLKVIMYSNEENCEVGV